MKKKARQSAANRDERRFLEQYDASEFPHPSVAVDIALLTVAEGAIRALLVRRGEHPDRGKWSLPGGFVQMRESLEDAALRLLSAKAGVQGIFLEQLYTFGAPDRDPRTRVITVTYYALVEAAKLSAGIEEGKDIQLAPLDVPWKGEKGGLVRALAANGDKLPLAFDHAEILGAAVQRLRGKLKYAPLGFELLPKRFTLRDLQTIHESILGKQLNKDSFRRSMLASGLIAATGQRETDVGHRPAEIYRFRRK